MIPNTDFALVSALDLSPIKTKLMHVASGEGWSHEHANAVEIEYRRFLYLMKTFPNEQIAPSRDVDTFWHYHILDTRKYARDCQEAFGYFVHHYPYLGMAGEDGLDERQQSGERMRELYEWSFGESYGHAADVPGEHAPQEASSAATYGHAQARAGQTARCVRPGAKAAGAEAAWCIGTGNAKAAHARTAWCIGTGNAKAADVPTAYCIGPGRVTTTEAPAPCRVGSGIPQEA